ncbi:anaerobic C4-dicarboxylate transporter [Aliivibrio fischeri]|uniref:anaerobic C4-dicarboxylate transporter n=1 Tax=Aliivibrio fischeri TaxID=668 RepID=UPI00080E8F2F|nr:anaerobic C4-dicarboxylate transporter [Aliivibrio fischeri]MUJ29169.1 anaerobic C4-dicarboxylate transporter [Aliivibrio fischeri]MUL03082.1 anaerobic C4-dicarboxylate transporter [Aliivibrio fischeri]OCH03020.1 C4-dicarboxylate ABC transporter [Aliivibrio fischeri]OCH04885.1 C4-dicarboxylate ABC transporter [Aliivibrio fischeri]OCH09725.1 C4-dicarboxylate ABC transporter [Aliivibrio fischeri]
MSVIIEISVVLICIYWGLKMGGLGVGLAGGFGLAVLTLGLGLEPSAPAIDVILIIMSVVTAASTMQAAGGMEWLVHHAGNLMRRHPKYINVLAPIITWCMTIMAGTGYTVFSTLPVISEVAKEIGERPSRPLSAAVVASQVAISGSPISAAMAAMISIMEPAGVSFLQIMAICLPASFIAAMVAAFVASRQGCELKDDVVYQQIQKEDKQQVTSITKEIDPKAKYSVFLFALATCAIVLYAAIPSLRPAFPSGDIMTTRDIIIVSMFAAACLMVPMCNIHPDRIIKTTTFRSGMSSVAVILGIVTMGSTVVNAHLPEIKEFAGSLLNSYPMLLSLVLFGTCTLLMSQGATTPLIVPLALSLNVPHWAILASFVAVTGVFVLPTYPTSLAAIEFDSTGSTRMGKNIFDHPFMLPGLTGVIVAIGFGFLLAPAVL